MIGTISALILYLINLRSVMRVLTRISIAAALSIAPFSVFAIPALQLDIVDGIYFAGSEESTLTSADKFTLQALGLPGGGPKTVSDSFDFVGTPLYLSVAVISDHEGITGGTEFGSFSVNGTSYITGDLVYDIPPSEAFDPDLSEVVDMDGLSKHGIYPTLFKELTFNFDAVDRIDAYNVQDQDPEDTADSDETNNTMYFTSFEVDVSGMLDGYELHFDLYAYEDITDKKVTMFAPFSHDAGTTDVTEPSVLALMGLGIVGIGFIRRHRMKT